MATETVWIVFYDGSDYDSVGDIKAVFANEEEARAYREAKGFTMYGEHKDYRYSLEEWEVTNGNVHST